MAAPKVYACWTYSFTEGNGSTWVVGPAFKMPVDRWEVGIKDGSGKQIRIGADAIPALIRSLRGIHLNIATNKEG